MQHALASVDEERNLGAVLPPWETALDGVVSLFAMLEFAARDYVDIAYRFGIVLGAVRGQQPNDEAIDITKELKRLSQETNRLGLLVTREVVGAFIVECMNTHSGTVSVTGSGDDRMVHFQNLGLSNERTYFHVEAIYSTLRAELQAMQFKMIPRERSRYSNGEWLKDSAIQGRFPTSFKELDRAGKCYGYGQGTAAVFHSMRALEPALVALAAPFPHISPAHENWNAIIEQIESAVREMGKQKKSQQKTDEETFFGSATQHLYFVKNAWRNHVAHGRESYGDDEAAKIMSRTLEFTESLCPRFRE
jgi:hypothetical protein